MLNMNEALIAGLMVGMNTRGDDTVPIVTDFNVAQTFNILKFNSVGPITLLHTYISTPPRVIEFKINHPQQQYSNLLYLQTVIISPVSSEILIFNNVAKYFDKIHITTLIFK